MSESMSLHEQIIYKLGQVEGSIEAGFKRIDERLERLTSDHSNADVKISKIEDRVNLLESWADTTKAKTAVLIAIGGVVIPAVVSVLIKVF